MPSAFAAAAVRSHATPRRNGPRSITLTVTKRPAVVEGHRSAAGQRAMRHSERRAPQRSGRRRCGCRTGPGPYQVARRSRIRASSLGRVCGPTTPSVSRPGLALEPPHRRPPWRRRTGPWPRGRRSPGRSGSTAGSARPGPRCPRSACARPAGPWSRCVPAPAPAAGGTEAPPLSPREVVAATRIRNTAITKAQAATRSGRPPGDELYVGERLRICARRGPSGVSDTFLSFRRLRG